MKKSLLKILVATGLGLAILASAAVVTAQRNHLNNLQVDTESGQSVTILPAKISKSLKIQRIPTSRPVPLIIGTYWDCHVNEHDFEICDVKLVVCTDDQSVCTVH